MSTNQGDGASGGIHNLVQQGPTQATASDVNHLGASAAFVPPLPPGPPPGRPFHPATAPIPPPVYSPENAAAQWQSIPVNDRTTIDLSQPSYMSQQVQANSVQLQQQSAPTHSYHSWESPAVSQVQTPTQVSYGANYSQSRQNSGYQSGVGYSQPQPNGGYQHNNSNG